MTITVEDLRELISDGLRLAENVVDAAVATRTELGGLGAMFLARAGQSVFSAGLLAENGLNGDAMSVARTVTEMSIDFAYIATDPSTLIKKFVEYDHVTKFKIAKATDELHGGTIDKQAMRMLEERHDTARLNNPESEHNWAGVSIRKRAIKVDQLRTYELSYADMCNASHSCYGTLEYALVGHNTDAQIHFGPMAPDTKAPDLAFAAMSILTIDVIQACSLDKALYDGVKQLHDKRRSYSPNWPSDPPA